MKAPRAARVCAGALTLLSGTACIAAESRDVAYSTYANAGAAFGDAHVHAVLLERRAAVSEHFVFSAALAYFDLHDVFQELQLRLAVTGAVTLEDWTIEDRQLITVGEDSEARYRNRLRVVRAGLFDAPRLSVRAFDELHIDLEHDRVLRNDLALGFGVQLNARCSAELYHVWADNRHAGGSNYALVLLAVKLD